MVSSNEIKKYFFEYAFLAYKSDEDSMDIRRSEPFFEKVLNLIEKNPSYQKDFIKWFFDIYSLPELYQPELVSFCMHVLRWSEMKEKLEKLITTSNSERLRYFYKKQLEAFEDDWRSADLYVRFGNNK